MSTHQSDIDERTNLAGSNKFEMLMFRLGKDKTLGQSELFGINVFKIREIMAMPQITPVVGAHPSSLGVLNLRGQVIPVFDLPAIVGCNARDRPEHLAGHRIRTHRASLRGRIRGRHCPTGLDASRAGRIERLCQIPGHQLCPHERRSHRRTAPGPSPGRRGHREHGHPRKRAPLRGREKHWCQGQNEKQQHRFGRRRLLRGPCLD